MRRPVLFWDSAGLIAGVFAEHKSPYRELLRLGAVGAVDMRLSPDVARECDGILRRYGEEEVERLARLLDRANFAVTLSPDEDLVAQLTERTAYRNDARVVAAAEECAADVLITYDRKHLLGNPLLGPPDTYCRILTLQEALVLLRQRLSGEGDLDAGPSQ